MAHHALQDPVGGYLEIGTNGAGQVVVNHKDMQIDARGWGFIEFSPDQAEQLARLLLRKAGEARGEKN